MKPDKPENKHQKELRYIQKLAESTGKCYNVYEIHAKDII